jgi:hypothetical protein
LMNNKGKCFMGRLDVAFLFDFSYILSDTFPIIHFIPWRCIG